VGTIEERWRRGVTRRSALSGLAGFLAASPLLRAQEDARPLSEHKRALGLGEMRNVWDFEAVFGANETLTIRDYTAHGDGTEWTVRRNRQAFDWVDIVPGKRVDPKSVDLSTQVFDTKMAFPIMIAPTSGHNLIHPDAEAGTQRGALGAKTPYVVASGPSIPLAKIVAVGPGPIWYQQYGQETAEANRATLEQAVALGCQAIVVTVDQQAAYYPRTLHDRNLGARSADTGRGGAPRAAATSGAGLYRLGGGRLWYTWTWLDEIRKMVNVPFLVKGILTGEDAQMCVDRGLGVYVSNHGGRSMDYGPSTLEVLPEVVDVVRGRVPVVLDSGIRRGTDILKALALGANAVCIGRPARWGLGAFGAAGVQRVFEILQAETVEAAAAAGCTTLASINRTILRTHFS
jgi:4-hydroxymandelate oxidase